MDRQAVLEQLDEEGAARAGCLETCVIPEGAGWAVYSGCEGEDSSLVAVFCGRGARACADALLAAKDTEDGEMVDMVFEGVAVPAFVRHDGSIVVGNHATDDLAIAALAELFETPAERWQ